MNQNYEHVLDPACPWYSLKSIRLPHVRWCEDQLCSWVESPANTWSNFGYILAGLIIHQMSKGMKSRPLRFYGTGAVIVGLCSLIYHASNSFVLQIFDFFGMYVDCYLLLFINFERLGMNVIRKSFGKYWAAVCGTTLFTVLMDFTRFPIQGLILFLILGIVGTEIIAYRKRTSPYSIRYFMAAMVSMGIAITCSALDFKRVFCNPADHLIQGHALWHWFGALGMFFSFLHYRQFDQQLAE